MRKVCRKGVSTAVRVEGQNLTILIAFLIDVIISSEIRRRKPDRDRRFFRRSPRRGRVLLGEGPGCHTERQSHTEATQRVAIWKRVMLLLDVEKVCEGKEEQPRRERGRRRDDPIPNWQEEIMHVCESLNTNLR